MNSSFFIEADLVVLFKKIIIQKENIFFDKNLNKFGIGEDQLFFSILNKLGYRIIWSNTLKVYEKTHLHRSSLNWVTNRSFRLGVLGLYIDIKVNAVMAYSSQFYDPKSKELETPITSKNFIDSIVYRAQDLGRLIGVETAEGFTVERYTAVESLSDLI